MLTSGHARQERVSRKAVREFPVERTGTGEQFLQAFKRSIGFGLSLRSDQAILWGERPEEHRPGGFLQAVFGGLSGEHHQRPQAYRPLFYALGHPIFHWL